MRVFFPVLLLVACSASAQTFQFGATVELEGILTSGSGKTPDEVPVSYPVLSLAEPITVVALPSDPLAITESGVKLVQLSLDEKEMATFKALKGKRVVVAGELMHSHTGHHHTEVLLLVSSLHAP